VFYTVKMQVHIQPWPTQVLTMQQRVRRYRKRTADDHAALLTAAERLR
jgi:hypothetical protein